MKAGANFHAARVAPFMPISQPAFERRPGCGKRIGVLLINARIAFVRLQQRNLRVHSVTASKAKPLLISGLGKPHPEITGVGERRHSYFRE